MSPLAAQGTSASADPTEPVLGEFAIQPKPRLRRGLDAALSHLKHHVGVGIVCSVAYFDPGNWSVDLQAGSQYGYRPMLFIVLLAGLGAIVLQSLASKLGCVTGLDLASHCRVLLHDRPKHRRLTRCLVLYPLYVLSEIAIISTDLAELLGSAIGLCLLIPSLPLWAAVLATAGDVLIFLLVGDPSRPGRTVRMFEMAIMAMVFVVFACFVVLLVKVKPLWPEVFLGFVPSAKIFDTHTDILYTAVGILGATVMPHGLFLGSFLATRDRFMSAREPVSETGSGLWLLSLVQNGLPLPVITATNMAGRTTACHIIGSLLGLAVPINSAILILAAAVFFQKDGSTASPASLFDAHQLIVDRIGGAAGVIFALALLSSGQSSSITATLAGQVVSEGFIEWRVSPFLRRIITRLIGLVPSMVVAIAVGRPGINMLLVASQVVLSVVLPFVAFPLIWLTASPSIMRVKVPRTSEKQTCATEEASGASQSAVSVNVDLDEHTEIKKLHRTQPEKQVNVHVEAVGVSQDDEEYVDFSNSRWLTALAGLIFVVVLAANVYVFVMLGLGKT